MKGIEQLLKEVLGEALGGGNKKCDCSTCKAIEAIDGVFDRDDRLKGMKEDIKKKSFGDFKTFREINAKLECQTRTHLKDAIQGYAVARAAHKYCLELEQEANR